MAKDFEKKYLKLKKKNKLLYKMLKSAMKVVVNAAKERNSLLEKRNVNDPWKTTMEEVETEAARLKDGNELVQIVLEPECLWLSEILGSSNNLKIELVSKFFIGQLGIRDIKAKEIFGAKPETDGKDGKWVVLYAPFKEPEEQTTSEKVMAGVEVGANVVIGGNSHIPTPTW